MPNPRMISVFVSYAHKDEDYHRRLAEHLDNLKTERRIDAWDDRRIEPGQDWNKEIEEALDAARIILFLVSPNFLSSKFVCEQEIPRAVARAERGEATVVPVILEKCDWEQRGLAKWQALPPAATPVADWPSRDVAYAQVASGIAAVADGLRTGVVRRTRMERERRTLTIYRHTPFRILGEAYDPFRAFEQVFRRVENLQLTGLPPLPLDVPLGDRVEFVSEDYRTILAWLRDGNRRTGLPYDLVAIPYALLGHCVQRGLLQCLDASLRAEHEYDFAWWNEMGTYRGELYGVPLSALTMILAVRDDLFAQFGLAHPDNWEDYLALIDEVIVRCLPVAPDLLLGRSHVTLWYNWLNHLYANDSNDLVLYGGSRLPAREAAETLRAGTRSFLTMAAKLASYADEIGDLPHWATANWDHGIETFAQGRLLMHWVFNDALDTLRRRMEVSSPGVGARARVRYLPVPKALGSHKRNGHVEGWILCVPSGSRYNEVANRLLHWFLDLEVQKEYARWGGASAHLAVIGAQPGQRDPAQHDDGAAAEAYRRSSEDSRQGRTRVDLVKCKEADAVVAIDRIVANLYDAVLAVAGEGESVETATETLIRCVERRLLTMPR